MKPYYEDDWHTLYLGDCREILPQLGPVETIITDPVWPNADVDLPGREDPQGLFREMCDALPGAERIVVQLGCDSDPRFLAAVPEKWPFLRVCWLDYARPSYKGRLLYTGDVAYAFGVPPAALPGRFLMSGMCRSTKADEIFKRHTFVGGKHRPLSCGGRYVGLLHPCARRLEHVRFLVSNFSDAQVVDPFMGSGTTAVAAGVLNRHFIGIEINEEYCQLAVERLRQSVMDLRVA